MARDEIDVWHARYLVSSGIMDDMRHILNLAYAMHVDSFHEFNTQFNNPEYLYWQEFRLQQWENAMQGLGEDARRILDANAPLIHRITEQEDDGFYERAAQILENLGEGAEGLEQLGRQEVTNQMLNAYELLYAQHHDDVAERREAIEQMVPEAIRSYLSNVLGSNGNAYREMDAVMRAIAVLGVAESDALQAAFEQLTDEYRMIRVLVGDSLHMVRQGLHTNKVFWQNILPEQYPTYEHIQDVFAHFFGHFGRDDLIDIQNLYVRDRSGEPVPFQDILRLFTEPLPVQVAERPALARPHELLRNVAGEGEELQLEPMEQRFVEELHLEERTDNSVLKSILESSSPRGRW